MKRTLMGILLAGATCAFGLATPAVAQVAGNPGDLHSPTSTRARLAPKPMAILPAMAVRSDRWASSPLQ